MSISQTLINHVEQLQEQADRSYELYPEHDALLPNDAIYLARYHNLKAVCDLIEQAAIAAGGRLGAVLKQNLEPNLDQFVKAYPHTAPALRVIIRDFGE